MQDETVGAGHGQDGNRDNPEPRVIFTGTSNKVPPKHLSSAPSPPTPVAQKRVPSPVPCGERLGPVGSGRMWGPRGGALPRWGTLVWEQSTTPRDGEVSGWTSALRGFLLLYSCYLLFY